MGSEKNNSRIKLRYPPREILLEGCFYISDIDIQITGDKATIGFAAVSPEQTLFPIKQGLYMSPAGQCIALEDNGTSFNLIYVQQNSILKINVQMENTATIWPQDANHSATGFSPNLGYTPQGMACSKTGKGLLVCLWNNKIGERSLGKVISTKGDFEIFTDKGRPLYVCPTYIAENGNGDICVSDVTAVVVTDAGGMLRFRFPPKESEIEIDPYGICCDSICNIIIAEMKNNNILVINKNGEYCYDIKYQGIKLPRALCIDKTNVMYVGEWYTNAIKVIDLDKTGRRHRDVEN